MSQQNTESDLLFELKNCYYLQNYQAGINEGNSLKLKDSSLNIEKEIFIYKSYLALGNTQLILDEIKEETTNIQLKSIRILALYYHNLYNFSKKEQLISSLKDIINNNNDESMLLTAAIIYSNEGFIDDALRFSTRCSNSFEAHALSAQLYLRIHRINLAERELKFLQEKDEDATLTLLVAAWINLAIGNEKIQEAMITFQELTDKNPPSPLLLNGLAICNMHLRKYDEAEKLLLEALAKNPKDPNTIANLCTCLAWLNKPISRYVSLMKSSFSENLWTSELKSAEDQFDRAALKHSA
eukprot:TRINITY_DN1112_c1_g3_i1.p1 TRINITY_DN1112_c1_g3~~TRINITY_DN1112_c1_g3_i1.p1  ORF type:complete len:298 (+),score=136.62 TRINITY_DN1112_c1_g3_i1:71-964(+)